MDFGLAPRATDTSGAYTLHMDLEHTPRASNRADPGLFLRRAPSVRLQREELKMTMGGDASVLDWGMLVPRLVHETKVGIIEAMRWLDRPLSARELQGISGGAKSISNFEYHLRSLLEADCVALVSRKPVRGAHESHYFFSEAVRRSI